MNVVINYNDSRWEKYKIDFDAIADVVAQEIGGSRLETGEISIVLTNDREIRKLNKQYRGIDKATNVLSFETGDDVLLGDIYISFDTVMQEIRDKRQETRDKRQETRDKRQETSFVNHTTHLAVHGVLHLLGYDHIDDAVADEMENMEIRILKKLGIGNPYEDTGSAGLSQTGNRRPWDKVALPLLSLAFGGMACLGFAPLYLWPLTLVGIGGMYWLMTKDKRRRFTFHNSHFILPVIFGFAYAVASFWWVTHSIYVVPGLTEQFAIWTIPALIGIGLLGAVLFSIPFFVARRGPIVFAASWTLVLWLREWFLTGFPWNPIANITTPFPILSNSMSLWGALGLTFVITGLVASIIEGKRRSIYIFSVLLIVGCVYGYYNISKSSNIHHQSSVIRIIQPAESAEQKATHSREEALSRAEKNIEHLISLASAPGEYDLLVFPETSYPYLIVDNQIPFTDKFNVPVVIGSMSYNDGKIYNSLILARDGYVEKIYSKSHLVPFGEYRPFGDIIPTPGQLTSGNGPEVIHSVIGNRESGVDFAFVPAICYEIIFTDSLIPNFQSPISNLDFVLNITNDTWFGKTPGTYQHLDMVRRYAIESGLPIVRANYSGVSAFIGADGHIISSLPVGVAGHLDGGVYGAHMTPYRYVGRDGWMIIILGFSILCIVSKGKKNV